MKLAALTIFLAALLGSATAQIRGAAEVSAEGGVQEAPDSRKLKSYYSYKGWKSGWKSGGKSGSGSGSKSGSKSSDDGKSRKSKSKNKSKYGKGKKSSYGSGKKSKSKNKSKYGKGKKSSYGRGKKSNSKSGSKSKSNDGHYKKSPKPTPSPRPKPTPSPKPTPCPLPSCRDIDCFPYEPLRHPEPCGGSKGPRCAVADCCDVPQCVLETDIFDFFEPFNTDPENTCFTGPARPGSGHGFFVTTPLSDTVAANNGQTYFVVEGDDRNEVRVDTTGGQSTVQYVLGLGSAPTEPCLIVNIQAFGFHAFGQGMPRNGDADSKPFDGKIPNGDNEPNVCWPASIVEEWFYFDNWTGTVRGLPGTQCAPLQPTSFRQHDQNLQIGDKAAILGNGADMGMSGWLWILPEGEQPGPGPYVASPASQGDVNLNLDELCLFP